MRASGGGMPLWGCPLTQELLKEVLGQPTGPGKNFVGV